MLSDSSVWERKTISPIASLYTHPSPLAFTSQTESLQSHNAKAKWHTISKEKGWQREAEIRREVVAPWWHKLDALLPHLHSEIHIDAKLLERERWSGVKDRAVCVCVHMLAADATFLIGEHALLPGTWTYVHLETCTAMHMCVSACECSSQIHRDHVKDCVSYRCKPWTSGWHISNAQKGMKGGAKPQWRAVPQSLNSGGWGGGDQDCSATASTCSLHVCLPTNQCLSLCSAIQKDNRAKKSRVNLDVKLPPENFDFVLILSCGQIKWFPLLL